MNLFPRGKVSYSKQILFWSNGTIPRSAYSQIRKDLLDKNESSEIAMLEEWLVE